MTDTYALQLVTPPEAEPVSLAEAKEHLRVDSPDEDAYVSGLVAAARQLLEDVCGRQFVTATWELALDRFPCVADGHGGAIVVPRAKLTAVESIQYVAADGTTATLAADRYRVDARSEPGRITPAFGTYWPSALGVTAAVVVRFTAGYGAAVAVPDPLKHAIKLLVGHWYENREEVVVGTIATPLPMAVGALIANHRVYV